MHRGQLITTELGHSRWELFRFLKEVTQSDKKMTMLNSFLKVSFCFDLTFYLTIRDTMTSKLKLSNVKAYLSTLIALQCPLQQLCTNWWGLLQDCTTDSVRSGTSAVADLISLTVIVSWTNVFDHLGKGWNSRSQKKAGLSTTDSVKPLMRPAKWCVFLLTTRPL
jgi:hypothetical protein